MYYNPDKRQGWAKFISKLEIASHIDKGKSQTVGFVFY
jgi:hypothetical protein